MAKKFARRRNASNELDADTYQYMVRVLELSRGDFASIEEKCIFARNVYEQTIGHEVEYAKNQVGSRVLDSLLEYADLECIERLHDALSKSLRPLCSDRFASHVLQRILMICANRASMPVVTTNTDNSHKTKSETGDHNNDKNNDDSEHVKIHQITKSELATYEAIVLKLSRYFLNNVEEFVYDTYANHLLRTAFECLGGVTPLSNKTKDKQQENSKDKSKLLLTGERKRLPVGEKYKELLVQSCQRLLNWPRFREFGKDELTSALLQSVLYSVKNIESSIAETCVRKITEECFSSTNDNLWVNGQLPRIFEEEPSIRLLETCLAVATSETFDRIYHTFFVDFLKQLSLLPSTNFSVQRLLDHCCSKETFEDIYEKLSEYFAEIFASGHHGIFASLSNACLRLQTKQGAWLKDLFALLDCTTVAAQTQDETVLCLAGLKKRGQIQKLKESSQNLVTLHGSLTTQAMLKFHKPIKIVNALLEANIGDLIRIFNDPRGSRIIDAFVESTFIGEKSREKLVKKLKGHWAELAVTVHGSRCLETLWNRTHGNQRIVIMEELSAAGESLRSTKTGRIISTKLNVPLFARSKKDWCDAQGREEKTKALFADIIKPKKQNKK